MAVPFRPPSHNSDTARDHYLRIENLLRELLTLLSRMPSWMNGKFLLVHLNIFYYLVFVVLLTLKYNFMYSLHFITLRIGFKLIVKKKFKKKKCREKYL